MPSPPLSRDERSLAPRVSAAGERLRDTLDSLTTTAAPAARGAAFWSAVALPFLNLALLADGLSTTAEMTAFLALLAVNGLALYVGHPYASRS